MKKAQRVDYAAIIGVVMVLLSGGAFACHAASNPFVFSEHQITQTGSWETTPRLGNDGVSNIVVYTNRSYLPDGSMGSGSICFRRLDQFGNPTGPTVNLTTPPGKDDELNDISGDYIVFTEFDSTTALGGSIKVYRISAAMLQTIGTADMLQEPRISGNAVVWREGGPNASRVMIYDLAWLGTDRTPDVLAGPVPPTYNIDIGNRFVVWAELTLGQKDILAYDHVTGVLTGVTSTPAVIDSEPSTSGDWVVWQAQDKSVPASRIVVRNILTKEERVIADSGVYNFRPSISGDLITWESMLNGNMDIYVYRISTGETQRVSFDLADQYLNDVFGQLVAYVDQRTGTEDIYVSLLNWRPIANPGAGITVPHGSVVNLDGSSSSDPENNYPLSYAWEITQKPGGSGASLVNSTLPHPSFFTDNLGDYKIRLIVTDALGATSDPVEVLVSTTNTPPIANAGPDQAVVIVGSTVTLDGGSSYDLEGDPFTFVWTMTEKPVGSQAVLSNPTSAKPSYVADAKGNYVVSLVVTDAFDAVSASDTVAVSFNNVKPVANAGVNQAVDTGSNVNLNGAASSDANGDPLTYSWYTATKPVGSSANLINSTSVQPRFVADLAGTYVISLVVNDGLINSDPSNVTVTATLGTARPIQVLQDAIAAINHLDSSMFKNLQLKNPLTNKINAVLNDIQNGLYADALSKLQNDILKKTDGCAAGGSPDKNDWIITCPAQSQVYPILLEAISLLQGM